VAFGQLVSFMGRPATVAVARLAKKINIEKLRNCRPRYSECADPVNAAQRIKSILSSEPALLSRRSEFSLLHPEQTAR
jgi:hypothetical protein